MTELEKMERAQMYLKKMAFGINPITDENADENDTINNVRISRCLSYVAEILQQVIDNGGEINRKHESKQKTYKFFITDEQRVQLVPESRPIFAKDIADIINRITEENDCTLFVARWLTEYLVSIGLLTQKEKNKVASESGKAFGIFSEQRIGKSGNPYTATLYPPEAQQFIFDNIDAIVDYSKSEEYKEKTKRTR